MSPTHPTPEPGPAELPPDTCPICGSDRLYWRSCKELCGNCGAIVRSCADS